MVDKSWNRQVIDVFNLVIDKHVDMCFGIMDDVVPTEMKH